MSNNATGWQTTPPAEAWPLESRRQMMRDVVRMLAEKQVLRIENATAIAATYGLTEAEATGEMMKHLSESEGK